MRSAQILSISLFTKKLGKTLQRHFLILLIKFQTIIGKFIYKITQLLHLGAGGTWPGEILLKLNPNILSSLIKSFNKGIIIVVGTNGKTTTTLMIKQILEKNHQTVVHNATGANLINGIISSLLISSNWQGKIQADWGVFEVDENSLPQILKELRTLNFELRTIIVLLNLFRDQLDRYGEVDVIIEKWQIAMKKLNNIKDSRLRGNDIKNNDVTLILNADDPGIAYLGSKFTRHSELGSESQLTRSGNKFGMTNSVFYFGLNEPEKYLPNQEHAQDSAFCLNCGARLFYEGIYFSHLGIWKCDKCGFSRPLPNLSDWEEIMPGLYNKYNTLAAVSVGREIGIEDDKIKQALNNFQPAFGRQEEFLLNNKKIKIFLSKNPAGFNASLRTVLEFKPKCLLLALNDRIPDGKDVSWIWDVDFEMIFQDEHMNNLRDQHMNKPHEERRIIVSGDRVYDLGVRMKYALKSQNLKFKSQNYNEKFKIEQNLKYAIENGLNKIKINETLYILATYSAMLEVRKILGGRKIL